MDQQTIFNMVMQIYNTERYRPENADKSSEDLMTMAETLVDKAITFAKTKAAEA